MSSDLGRSLEEASVGPHAPLDMSKVWSGARKRARMVKAAAVIGMVATTFAAFGIYQEVSDDRGENGFQIVPATSTSPQPEPSCYTVEDDGEGEPGVEITVQICSTEEDEPDPSSCAEIVETKGDRPGDIQITVERGSCPKGQFLVPPSPAPAGSTVKLCAVVRGPGGAELEPAPKEQGDCPEGQTQITAETSKPASRPIEAFAIWPADTEDRSRSFCQRQASHTSDPSSAALGFASAVLQWPSALAEPRENGTIEVRREVAVEEAAVLISTSEVRPGCWFVTGVSRLADRRPTGVGVSVGGRRFSMSFDPLGADEVQGHIRYGNMGTNLRWVEGETIFEGQLGTRPRTSGHFLILFLDENGEVFSAAGSALPAGNFTAG